MTQVESMEQIDVHVNTNVESEKEEGELSDVGGNDVGAGGTFEDIISSEEEFELRERIAELEARNLELEKIASISSNSYEVISDSTGYSDSEISFIKTPSPPQWHASSKRQKSPKKRTPRSDHGRKSGFRGFERNHRVSTRSKRKIRRSRKRKSDKRKTKQTYTNSSSEESDVPYNREELEAALWRDKFRNQYNPNFIDANSLKAKLLSSPDDDILRLSTDEILRLSDSEEAVLKLRLEALKTKTELRELSPEVEIIEPKPMVVDLTDGDDGKDEELNKREHEEASLEEQELRLAALKSAYIKKSIARKRKKLLTERPYSPTDNIEKIDCSQLTLLRDETDYSDNNMDISPINSPVPNDNDICLIDMEIVQNSPVSFVESLFADEPLYSNSVTDKINTESTVERVVQNIFSSENNPEMITNENISMPIPEVRIVECLPNKLHAPPTNDDNTTDISLEADCLRSLLLKNLKKKAEALQISAMQPDITLENQSSPEVLSEVDTYYPKSPSLNQISNKSFENLPREISPVIVPPKSNENLKTLPLPSPVLQTTPVMPLVTISMNKSTSPKAKELAKTKSSTSIVTKNVACDNTKKLNTKNESFVFKKPIIPKTTITKPIGITKLKKAPTVGIKKLLTNKKIENINILPKKPPVKPPVPSPNKFILKPSTTVKTPPSIPTPNPPKISTMTKSIVNPTPSTNRLMQTFESITVPKLVIRLGNSDSDSDDFNMQSMSNEKENTPNLKIVTSNNNFEAKLDAFLKSARSRVEQTVEPEIQTPTKAGVATSDIAPTTTVSTPVAVRHLPLSSQVEYKKLLNRMKILEQRKLDRLTTKITQTTENISVTVQNDLTDAEKEAINFVPENSLTMEMSDNTQHTNKIDSITVKVELSSNIAKRSVTTAKSVNTGLSVKKRLAPSPIKDKMPDAKKSKIVQSVVNDAEREYQNIIESLKAKNVDEKLEILKIFESNYASSSDSFVVELDALISLMQIAQKEKEKQLIIENDVSELRQKLEEREKELTEQNKKCSQIYPKICDSHKGLLETRKKCTDIDKYCRKAGQIIKGEKYKIPNNKVTIIMEKLKNVTAETKKFKNFNLTALPSPNNKSSEVGEKAKQIEKVYVKSGLDEKILDAEKIPDSSIELNNDASNSLRQYQSPLQFLKSVDESKYDPNAVICPFELGGKCEDSTCQYKHLQTENSSQSQQIQADTGNQEIATHK